MEIVMKDNLNKMSWMVMEYIKVKVRTRSFEDIIQME